MNNIEYRELIIEMSKKEEKQFEIEGKAICFNEETVLYRDRFGNEYREIISPTALDGLNISNVPLVYNHESAKAKVLARQKNKTLALEVREDGLYFRATLKTNFGKDIYNQILDGEISKCSFGFIVEEEEFDEKTFTRTIKKIKELTDISIVDYPAYEQTSVKVRDCFTAHEEMLQKAIDKEKQKKLILMLSV